METSKKSTAKYWLYFFVWTIIMLVLIVMPNYRPFFWLALPGVFTYFALGMDLI
jgi:hypothetical protein